MDCGSVYIKMCEKAEEIQKHQLKADDYFAYLSDEGEYKVLVFQRYRPLNRGECAKIFLARQDQLQEILSKYYASEMGMVETVSFIKQVFLDFAQWLNQQYEDHPFVCVPTNCFSTGEQLWLAFVMQECWDKVWNGQEWAKKAAPQSQIEGVPFK